METNFPDVTFGHILMLGHILPTIVYVADNELLGKLTDDQTYLLHQGGILDDKYEMTMLGEQVFASIDMIRYIVEVGSELISADPQPTHYDTLRKGLGQVAEAVNLPMLDGLFLATNTLRHTPPENPMIIDYCGGDGTYLKYLVEHLSGKGMLLDRNVDAAAENLLHTNSMAFAQDVTASGMESFLAMWEESADIVLLNEVLHLGDGVWRSLVMLQCCKMLRPGGFILIGELEPQAAFDFRISVLSDKGGKCMAPNEIADLVDYLNAHDDVDFSMALDGHITNGYYYYAVVRKGGVPGGLIQRH